MAIFEDKKMNGQLFKRMVNFRYFKDINTVQCQAYNLEFCLMNKHFFVLNEHFKVDLAYILKGKKVAACL